VEGRGLARQVKQGGVVMLCHEFFSCCGVEETRTVRPRRSSHPRAHGSDSTAALVSRPIGPSVDSPSCRCHLRAPYCRIANLVDKRIAQAPGAGAATSKAFRIGVLREQQVGKEKALSSIAVDAPVLAEAVAGGQRRAHAGDIAFGQVSSLAPCSARSRQRQITVLQLASAGLHFIAASR